MFDYPETVGKGFQGLLLMLNSQSLADGLETDSALMRKANTDSKEL